MTTDWTPKYMTTYRALRDRCKQAEPGSSLPSEAQLCDEYGVSRITLRKAVELLVGDGLVRKEQGRGTFVAAPELAIKHRESFVDSIRGFYTDMTLRGHVVGSRVISQELRPAPEAVARELEIPAMSPTAFLRRVRTVDGELNHVGQEFLPAQRFPDFDKRDLSSGSLYDLLAQEYGVRLVSSRFVVEVGMADREMALLLSVVEGSPLLVVRATVKDEDGIPVVYSTSWFLPNSSQVEFAAHVRGEVS